VFCEPASAASVAGVAKLVRQGYFAGEQEADASVACIITGHGLKDPDRAIATAAEPEKVEANVGAVVELLGLREPALVG
jgi:threonine synthase